MRFDQVQQLGESQIQHGPANDRVYLMKMAQSDFPQIIGRVLALAKEYRYSKIFAKIPLSGRSRFEKEGFRLEARIPKFYGGREDGLFMARYLESERQIDPAADQVKEVLEAAKSRMVSRSVSPLADGYSSRLLTARDCDAMAALYREIFSSYPFPIHDPAYLEKTMMEDVVYSGISKGDQLLAVASAEVDRQSRSAELTDFATDRGVQGQGLANHLLQNLEAVTQAMGIRTCYTIARATSFGMNICFAKNGYAFGGTLVKNTQIAGSLESMNVWYKQLPQSVQ